MHLNTSEPIAWRTFVRRDGTMTHLGPRRAAPTRLRKETEDWLTKRMIPQVREIAANLENAGEDVNDLLDSIDKLEAILRKAPERAAKKSR
jgi:hypothetical protein